jgi:hypothetical protein
VNRLELTVEMRANLGEAGGDLRGFGDAESGEILV